MATRDRNSHAGSARRAAASRWASGLGLVLLALAGCAGDIWNAGDLAAWVREQAVKKHDCAAPSIELEEWYTAEDSGNVWYGTCRREATGEEIRFGINVDSVWTPSEAPK